MDYQSKDLTIAALLEANELLGEENSRYRRSNALLRRINSDLRRLKNIQAANDDEFKSMCQGDIEVPLTLTTLRNDPEQMAYFRDMVESFDGLRPARIEVDVTNGDDGLSDPQAS